MINYETILSNYDDRLTLMQWLKKVEAALMAAALASVTITQPSDDTAVFNFVFADGTSVSSPSLNLPRGPQGEQGTQGEQGAQGVGVSNVTINSNSHLIVTLTNGVEIDAGYIETGSGVVVDTELSPTSTNPVENRVIYNVVTTAQNTISALGGRVTDAETDLTALGGRVTTAEGKISALDTRVTTAEGAITTLQNDKLEKVTAADVDSETATSGQVLTANGNGGAAWTSPQGGDPKQTLINACKIFNADIIKLSDSNIGSFKICSLMGDTEVVGGPHSCIGGIELLIGELMSDDDTSVEITLSHDAYVSSYKGYTPSPALTNGKMLAGITYKFEYSYESADWFVFIPVSNNANNFTIRAKGNYPAQ